MDKVQISTTSTSTNVRFAVALMITAGLILVALITRNAFFLSESIAHFFMGLVGIFSFPLFLGVGLMGLAILKGKKAIISRGKMTLLIVGGILGIVFLHIISTFSLDSSAFNQYLEDTYSRQTTIGGALFGVLAFPLVALVGPVAALLLLAFAIIAIVYFYSDYGKNLPLIGKNFNRNRPSSKSKQASTQTKFDQSLPTQTHFGPISSGLYVGEIETRSSSNSLQNSADILPVDLKQPVANNVNIARDNVAYNSQIPYQGFAHAPIAAQYQYPNADIPYTQLHAQNHHNNIFSSDVLQNEQKSSIFVPHKQSLGGGFQPYSQKKEEQHRDYRQILYGESKKEGSNLGFVPFGGSINNSIPKKKSYSNSTKKDFVLTPESAFIEDYYQPSGIINGDQVTEHQKDITGNARAGWDYMSDEGNQKKKRKNHKKSHIDRAFVDFEADYNDDDLPPITNGDYFYSEVTRQSNKEASDTKFKHKVNTVKNNAVKDSDKNVDFVAPIIAGSSFEKVAYGVTDNYSSTLESEDNTNNSVTYDRQAQQVLLTKSGSNASNFALDDEQVQQVLPAEGGSNANNFALDDGYSQWVGVDSTLQDVQSSTVTSSSSDYTGYYIHEHGNQTTSQIFDNPIDINAIDLSTNKQFDSSTKHNAVKAKPARRRKYVKPSIDLLIDNSSDPIETNGGSQRRAEVLIDTLSSFGLDASVKAITKGPAVTRYEIEMPPGVPIRKIEHYTHDLAYNLESNGKIRIEMPIPGKKAIGIEVPNSQVGIVGLKDIIDSKEFRNAKSPLTLALGKDITGELVITSLDTMPHLLIAGATNSGKSACLNAIIISILYKSSPDDVKMILIDPKRVELSVFAQLPHLIVKDIVTETTQAINAFNWAISEMNRRYTLLSQNRVRNIVEFNNCAAVSQGHETKLPYIVIIVDELADLMMTNKKDIEDKIRNITQKARAAGIHLIVATQRPSVDVITGTIKANLPSRIAFAVTSIADSRTVLDHSGAESLLGRGDMLYSPIDNNTPRRVQGAYITSDEVLAVVDSCKNNNDTDYDEEVAKAILRIEEENELEEHHGLHVSEDDPLLADVLRRVIETGQASTSMIQRRFSVGYARASRMIDQMESKGYIGPLDGSKPREVRITKDMFRQIFGQVIDN